jgi:rRNA maturation RNase YbeY
LKALQFLKLKQPVELAVLVVDKKEIKRLNKIWRKVNKVPDELSFGLNSRQTAKFAKGPHSMLSLGEIIINAEQISDKNYLSKILVHSLLHLLGYSHGRMKNLENKILESLKI